MKTHIRLIIFITFAASLSCNKASSPVREQSNVQVSTNKVIPAPVIVRLHKDQISVLAELKLSYEGDSNMESRLNEQKETVQNLVIQTVSGFSFAELNSKSGKNRFQRQLLSSVNQFLDKKSFDKISVLEIKEI